MFQLPGVLSHASGDQLAHQRERISHRDNRPSAVVVVDDEPDVLAILHRLMRDLAFPYDIVAAASGQTALDQIELYAVPLLITDFSMPRMNGVELIEAVRQLSPNTRVALISAYPTDELERQAHEAQVDYYLPKPFHVSKIQQMVRECLNVSPPLRFR
jgi:two-component system, response regulator, stage 0 sporulation protein F